MTTNKPTEIVPTQADRSAVANLARNPNSGLPPFIADAVEAGEMDWHPLVQAFAAHRLASTAPASDKIAYDEKAIDAVQKLLECGKATVDSDGYLVAYPPPASKDEVERKGFPVLGSQGAIVDWQFVHDHGKQANDNHRQSVERLAERGGLSWGELHAVVHNRKYEKIDTNEAMLAVRSLEARYLAALRPQPAVDEVELDHLAELLANFARDRFANTKELTWATMGEHSQQYFRDAVNVVRAALRPRSCEKCGFLPESTD